MFIFNHRSIDDFNEAPPAPIIKKEVKHTTTTKNVKGLSNLNEKNQNSTSASQTIKQPVPLLSLPSPYYCLQDFSKDFVTNNPLFLDISKLPYTQK